MNEDVAFYYFNAWNGMIMIMIAFGRKGGSDITCMNLLDKITKTSIRNNFFW